MVNLRKRYLKKRKKECKYMVYFFRLLLFSASYSLILYYQMQMLGLHDTCVVLVLLFDMRGEYQKTS